jgi:two-component system, chemotaxis family, sensor kinase CheA
MMSSKKVLCVDDNKANCELVENIFDAFFPEYELIKKHNSIESLEYLKNNSIVLGLVDINLPDKNGDELISLIRTLPGYENLPAIAITGSIVYKNKKSEAKKLFDEIIYKPIDIHKLKELIEKYI